MIRDLTFDQTLGNRFVAVFLLSSITVILSVMISIFKESIPKIICFLLRNFVSPEMGDTAQSLIDPYKVLIQIIIILCIAEIIILLMPFTNNYPFIEILISLGLTLIISWLVSRVSSKFLDKYLLDLAAKNGKKANSKLFISAKFSPIHKFLLFPLLFLLKLIKLIYLNYLPVNEKIARKLKSFGIEFVMEKPKIYVESPVTM